MPLTVTRLARACHLARSTVLYYESIGLLKRPRRTSGNYRLYTGSDLDRLRQICAYRNSGLTLADIRSLLDAPHTASAAEVLRRRMVELGKTIEQLREHQQAIARLLQIKSFTRSNKMITKEKWVAVMRSAGFTDEDMHRWHTEFEKSAPAEHQEFLEFLHIPAAEIAKIRDWSRLQS
ncbi:MAG TPA: MerR family transcriptional regulator [Verrucomicrobiae bacterium]|nr:MerR family transcriptional regulator [Verrucomicrobiae bacterium]